MMSLLLVFGAATLVAFLAMRSLRRHARHELHVVPQRLRPRPPRDAFSSGGGDYATAGAGIDAELRTIRGERQPSLYTPAQAHAARRAMAPWFGVTMRVKD